LLVGSAAPGLAITYAIMGDNCCDLMNGASFTTSFGSMLLYYFASMDRHDHYDITNERGQKPPLSSFKSFLASRNRRGNRSLAILALWAATIQFSIAIRRIHTNPIGIPFYG
jgi:hypothetical protein